MSETTKEALTVVILRPPQAVGPTVPLIEWIQASAAWKRPTRFIVVYPANQDDPLASLSETFRGAGSILGVPLAGPWGLGLIWKQLRPQLIDPLVLQVTLDYPYQPRDVPSFLARAEAVDERLATKSRMIVGVRSGKLAPSWYRAARYLLRGFAKIVLGMSIPRAVCWLGLREQLRAWQVRLWYGVPFQDPGCGFRLYRKDVFDELPIQSDGDFVSVELAAKLTFKTAILDEVILTPQPDVDIPKNDWNDWSDRARVAVHPEFVMPSRPQPESVTPNAQSLTVRSESV